MASRENFYGKKSAIVTGAGGFIGAHLVRFLKKNGYYVIGIDLKYPDYSKTVADLFHMCDLRDAKEVSSCFSQADELYMLAADMGGVGYINTVNAKIVHNSALINLHCLQQAYVKKIKKVFFASSACVYPEYKQDSLDAVALKESDAFPAQPDTPYGWEKLFIEQACLSYAKDYSIDVRIARFHNIFGPEGTYEGGREKSPAAICRKIALALDGGNIEVWGDGKQERSYCYIDDCVEGIWALMQSSYSQPMNIGSDRMVSINDLVDIVSRISEKGITVKHNLHKPQGVRSRNADITLAKELLNWHPRIKLELGLKRTYEWVKQRVENENNTK